MKLPEGDGFTVGAVLIHPESRGQIKLTSSDPTQAPAIYANYCSTEKDINTLVTGIKLSRRIVASPAFDHYRGDEYSPGTNIKDSDLQLGIASSARRWHVAH